MRCVKQSFSEMSTLANQNSEIYKFSIKPSIWIGNVHDSSPGTVFGCIYATEECQH